MSLYSKNLTSLDALRQEKKILEAKADDTINNIFSTGKANTEKTVDSSSVDSTILSGLDFLTSKGLINNILAIALPVLDLAKIKVEKKLVTKIAKEVLGNYLKWKAVMLVYKLTRDIISKKSSANKH